MVQRRCIHDESGNVDPVKAAETPVPRGSVVSKKRQAEDGSPAPAAKKAKPMPTPTPGPPPMQGLHGVLRPVSTHQMPKQIKTSQSNDNWSNVMPHGIPQYDDRMNGHPDELQVHQQHNEHPQHNQSAPPIDPSLMSSMYPEPANSHPFGGNAFPYPSNDRPSLYNLPSLEQIATEVLDMDGRGHESYENGLAAIEQFNRQREENVHSLLSQQDVKQANGSDTSIFADHSGQADGSVDSGVAMAPNSEKGGLPSGADKSGVSNYSGPASQSLQAGAVSIVPGADDEASTRHELPVQQSSSEVTSVGGEGSAQASSLPATAETISTSTNSTSNPEDKSEARRSSFASIPIYKPPAPPMKSPEVSRKDIAKSATSPSVEARSPTTPNRRKRGSFSSVPSAKKAGQEPSLPALEEEDNDVRLARSLQQEELGLRRR